jgi:hypothetical protein
MTRQAISPRLATSTLGILSLTDDDEEEEEEEAAEGEAR